jgi:predicted RNase H-like HicB family nuclease
MTKINNNRKMIKTTIILRTIWSSITNLRMHTKGKKTLLQNLEEAILMGIKMINQKGEKIPFNRKM